MRLHSSQNLCTAYLPLVVLISLSQALPSHSQHTKTLAPSPNWQPHHQPANDAPNLPKRVITDLIHPGFQAFLDIGSGWNMYYSSWHAASLPIQPAAWALTNLYAAVMVEAQGTWRKGKPTQILKANVGNIQLVMMCAEQPIPWDFVENFSRYMLQITKGGWTGVYQFMLSQAASGMSIGVELNVLPGG